MAILAVAFLFFFSSEFIFFSSIGHTNPVWLWLVLFCYFMLRGNIYYAAIFFAMTLCSRQTFVVFLPMVFSFWFRNYGFRNSAKYMLTTGLICLFICGPFLFFTPREFLLDPINHYVELGIWHFSGGESGHTAECIGFSYLLQTIWGHEALLIGRIVALIVTSILSLIYVRNISHMFIGMGVGVTAFYYFAPIPWHYIFFPPLIILSFAVISSAQQCAKLSIAKSLCFNK